MSPSGIDGLRNGNVAAVCASSERQGASLRAALRLGSALRKGDLRLESHSPGEGEWRRSICQKFGKASFSFIER